MSIKIYDAYEFKGPQEELLQFCKEVRLQWVEYFVGERIEPFNKNNDDIEAILNRVREETNKKHNYIIDIFDFKGQIVVYPHKERLFLQFFIDQAFLRKIVEPMIESDTRFIDYHYQDQSDPWYCFGEISASKLESELEEAEKDWKEREKIWNDIFEEYAGGYPISMFSGVPASSGFTYSIGSASDVTYLSILVLEKYTKKK